jgi:hypothetical protein
MRIQEDEKDIIEGGWGGEREREGYLGVLIRCFVLCLGVSGTSLLSTSAHRTLLRFEQSCSLAHPRHFSSPFLLYLTQFFLFS